MVQFPPSPCKRDCKLEVESGICISCGRTLDEIAEWGTATAMRQVQISDRASGRLTTPHSEDPLKSS